MGKSRRAVYLLVGRLTDAVEVVGAVARFARDGVNGLDYSAGGG